LAPNLAMLRQLRDALSDKRLRLFFGITNAGDLFCTEELHTLAQQLPHLACHIACVNADASWQHETGFVTDSLLKQMEGEDFTAYDYYLCGPPAMIEAVSQILHEKGVDSYQILREEFVASGLNADESQVV
jgi:NAD(P)H-flavin reductase